MSAEDWPVRIDPQWGCWLWQGKLDDAGYPIIWRGRRPVKAYLVVYEAEIGPVPPGLVLDHQCKVRSCVRAEGGDRGWSHLEPVTQSVNLQRRHWRRQVKRTRCVRNHDLALHRMVLANGGLLCRQCRRNAEGGG